MEAHVAMLEKIYKDATHTSQPKGESPTPYLKLIAHAKQREARAVAAETAAISLAQEREAERARLQVEFAALSQSCQATEAQNAEIATQLAAAEARGVDLESRLAAQEAMAAALAQEHDVAIKTCKLAEQRVEELEQTVSTLTEERDSIARRLAEFAQTPAARLQSLLVKLTKARRRGI
jgi:chromosome segregation ATPase